LRFAANARREAELPDLRSQAELGNERAIVMLNHWFANPWAFPLLGLPPLLGLLAVFALRRRNRALARLGSQPALELLVAERGWVRLLRGFLASLALTLLVVGIAGPQWGRHYTQA